MGDRMSWLVVAIVIGVFFFARGWGNTSSEDAHRLVAEGATLVDVRTPAEYAAGHIEGAVNIPVHELAERIGEIPADEPVVVYCASGNRSATAAEVLRDKGYAEVEDLGGMSRW